MGHRPRHARRPGRGHRQVQENAHRQAATGAGPVARPGDRSPRRASSATRSTASAARSARTSPARTAPNLDYLLENILDPSAVIPKEYAATRIDAQDGRVVTGIVKEETAAALHRRHGQRDADRCRKADIDSRKPVATVDDAGRPARSTLNEAEVRALIAYLQNPARCRCWRPRTTPRTSSTART